MRPLLGRFPALASLPRAALGAFPSPVERLDGTAGGPDLWVKRDDLNAALCGGNKVRALEFLLGGVTAGDTVLTLGGEGSTHVLATATHAGRLGAATVAVRWPHEMSPMAHRVARAAAERATILRRRSAVGAMATALRLRLSHPWRFVSLGGSTPLGILGHVDAALELASQVAGGALPTPARVVVPLGSGGTAAGLALGFAMAGLPTAVVGVRVGPRIAVNAARTRRLVRATAALIGRHSGAPLSRDTLRLALDPARLRVAHDAYGGAYGRPLAAGDRAAAIFLPRGLTLDATYSAKAGAAALAIAEREAGPTLFWLTFDGRGL